MAVNQAATAAQLTAAVAAVNAAIAAVGVLQDASPEALGGVYTAVQSAVAAFEGAVAAYDADIDTTSLGGVVPGSPVPLMVASLLEQAGDVTQQAVLVVAAAYVSRVGVNVLNAPG